jgi:hypothetical protein
VSVEDAIRLTLIEVMVEVLQAEFTRN